MYNGLTLYVQERVLDGEDRWSVCNECQDGVHENYAAPQQLRRIYPGVDCRQPRQKVNRLNSAPNRWDVDLFSISQAQSCIASRLLDGLNRFVGS